MKAFGVITTTALFLFLGATVPAFAQEEHHEEEAKPEKQQQQAKPAKQQEEAKSQTDSKKWASLDTAQEPAYGCCPGRVGTLGRFERSYSNVRGQDEGACT